MTVDRFGMTVLDQHECWQLLRDQEVGRLAVSIANHPDIFPVNYVVDHGSIVFRTAEGTKLAASVLGAAVAFEIDGYDAETRAASSAKERDNLSYREWAEQRLQRYYSVVEDLLWPDLIVVGGGVSRKSDKFLPHLRLRTPIVPAKLRNTAGIVGAAVLAAERLGAAA